MVMKRFRRDTVKNDAEIREEKRERKGVFRRAAAAVSAFAITAFGLANCRGVDMPHWPKPDADADTDVDTDTDSDMDADTDLDTDTDTD